LRTFNGVSESWRKEKILEFERERKMGKEMHLVFLPISIDQLRDFRQIVKVQHT
jgi:hypothetical protein